jgi:hypothetical protein
VLNDPATAIEFETDLFAGKAYVCVRKVRGARSADRGLRCRGLPASVARRRSAAAAPWTRARQCGGPAAAQARSNRCAPSTHLTA